MFTQIIQKTPIWVFALLAGLLYLGCTQLFTRTVGLRRTLIMPITMTALSVWGIVTSFHTQPAALLLWLVVALGFAALLLPVMRRAPMQYNTVTREFTLPGSVIPLVIILSIFMTKYIVGVTLGMHPEMAQNSTFAYSICALYGVLNGILLARTGSLLRYALCPDRTALGAVL